MCAFICSLVSGSVNVRGEPDQINQYKENLVLKSLN